MSPSDFLLRFLRDIEQFRPRPYLDAGGLATIGYGHLIRPTETFNSLTEDEGEALLASDAARAMGHVLRLTPGLPLLQRELDALTSLVYNIGPSNFESSTLRARLMDGEKQAAAHEFRRWYFAKGRPLQGLRKRRLAEELWFLGGHPDSVLLVLKGDWA